MTLILGKESSQKKSESGKTYNGVGKSLIVKLIHFCLGTNKITEFEEKIPDWEFSLEFEISQQVYKITRSTTDQNNIKFDDKILGVNALRQELSKLLFSQDLDVFTPNFRPIVSRFIRPSKFSYNEADVYIKKEKDFDRLLNNAFLLGLDTELIAKKKDLRQEKIAIKQLKENFDKDPILHSFYKGDRDPDIELQDLDEQIEKLSNDIKEFDVAEDYHEIRDRANNASSRIRFLENQAVMIKNAIDNIIESLKIRPDIPKEKVIKVYEDAGLHFQVEARKTLDDVLSFHEKLIENRKKRLVEEKEKLSDNLASIAKERHSRGIELDKSLKYLNSHRALDDFVNLSNLLKDCEVKAQKIRDYQSLIRQYEVKMQQLSISFNEQNIETQNYLDEKSELLKANISIFRSLAKEFYSDKSSGISVVSNVGENQIRFDIGVKIQDDASDGINEVKIFCYDLTNLINQHGHLFSFIFHDSRLYSNMDPRQRETLFKLAHKVTESKGFQYIASVNADQIESFKDRMDPKEFKETIEDNIKLELTDESAESKLLGVEVDMDYED